MNTSESPLSPPSPSPPNVASPSSFLSLEITVASPLAVLMDSIHSSLSSNESEHNIQVVSSLPKTFQQSPSAKFPISSKPPYNPDFPDIIGLIFSIENYLTVWARLLRLSLIAKRPNLFKMKKNEF